MLKSAVIRFYLILIFSLLLTASCGSGAPQPGQEMSFPEQGVSIRLAEGWEASVDGPDWSTWQRIQKGRTDEPWVMPPITGTNVAAGTFGPADRMMYWRLKGVRGNFDPTVDPLSGEYPYPPGLWMLNAQKLELLETVPRTLPWTGVEGIEATTRLYENTHGAGATAAIWHTYTVVFNVGPNAYEFVMSLPDFIDHREWIDKFWASVEELSIQQQPPAS